MQTCHIIFVVSLFALLHSSLAEPQCSSNGYLVSDNCVCFEPYGGDSCAIECSGRGAVDAWTGVCNCTKPIYSGSMCEVVCHGNGAETAAEGVCSCFAGFSGDTCEIECSGHGSMDINGGCLCEKGWGMKHCASRCSGHGLPNAEGECVCSGVWAGPACDLLCNSHGTITDLSKPCQLCDFGYSGPACATECSGYGSLNKEGKCECVSPHYTGATCEVECNGNGVVKSGVCQCTDPTNKDQYCYDASSRCGPGTLQSDGSCKCPANFTGTYCQDEVLPVVCEHGTLSNGVCLCAFGYSGDSCALECSGHGSRNTSGSELVCECDAHWSGSTCNVSCSGHGSIVSGSCKCVSEVHTGSNCEIECNGQGRYNSSSKACDCRGHYMGTLCNTPCSGNGIVVVTPDGGDECACASPYSGTRCDRVCEGFPTSPQSSACSCPAILGATCGSVCSGVGFLSVKLNGKLSNGKKREEDFVLPRIDLSTLDLPALLPHNATAIQTATALLNVSWPASVAKLRGWTVTHAECVCMAPAYTGAGCETSCNGHGSLSPAKLPNLLVRFSQLDRCLRSVDHVGACIESARAIGDSGAWCTCAPLYDTSYLGHECVPCGGQGTLQADHCVCTTPNVMGDSCQVPCNGHGHLAHDGLCVCDYGISGRHCEKACDWLCKGGECNGEECQCFDGFFGEWCSSSCYMRQGIQVCEQILFPNEPPLRHKVDGPSTSYVVVIIVIYISIITIIIILSCAIRRFCCVGLFAYFKRKHSQNRSRYMKDRPVGIGGGGDDTGIERRTLIKEDAAYESYDNPDYRFSTDHHLDEQHPPSHSNVKTSSNININTSKYTNNSSNNSSNNNNKNNHTTLVDDELEVDLHSDEFRSP